MSYGVFRAYSQPRKRRPWVGTAAPAPSGSLVSKPKSYRQTAPERFDYSRKSQKVVPFSATVTSTSLPATRKTTIPAQEVRHHTKAKVLPFTSVQSASSLLHKPKQRLQIEQARHQSSAKPLPFTVAPPDLQSLPDLAKQTEATHHAIAQALRAAKHLETYFRAFTPPKLLGFSVAPPAVPSAALFVKKPIQTRPTFNYYLASRLYIRRLGLEWPATTPPVPQSHKQFVADIADLAFTTSISEHSYTISIEDHTFTVLD